ncbi:hypothetical protein CS022_22690 [Veronia nyctiphanis]|uniref:Uncharacterized protein n=1 Tax=Veronia nyctiphanis TaxID=1278244 RepID=A0A4Q0YJU6_9GAMM|nr:hypothetical protein [Veronia nyctiphanis]RXJ70675.1 hypothetical protein CS022_22690 [Veronia nyctiphanis]
MNNEIVSLCYDGESGQNNIRTFNINDILYISLKDIFVTLTKENNKLDERYASKHIPTLIKSQVNKLDTDEYILLDVSTPFFEGEKEVFITQPG